MQVQHCYFAVAASLAMSPKQQYCSRLQLQNCKRHDKLNFVFKRTARLQCFKSTTVTGIEFIEAVCFVSLIYVSILCLVCVLAVTGAAMQLVEPIMTVEITAPDEFQGAVMGGVNKRNGTILGSSSSDGYFTIDAEVRDGLGWVG